MIVEAYMCNVHCYQNYHLYNFLVYFAWSNNVEYWIPFWICNTVHRSTYLSLPLLLANSLIFHDDNKCITVNGHTYVYNQCWCWQCMAGEHNSFRTKKFIDCAKSFINICLWLQAEISKYMYMHMYMHIFLIIS